MTKIPFTFAVSIAREDQSYSIVIKSLWPRSRAFRDIVENFSRTVLWVVLLRVRAGNAWKVAIGWLLWAVPVDRWPPDGPPEVIPVSPLGERGWETSGNPVDRWTNYEGVDAANHPGRAELPTDPANGDERKALVFKLQVGSADRESRDEID